jgi:hypothetical protein
MPSFETACENEHKERLDAAVLRACSDGEGLARILKHVSCIDSRHYSFNTPLDQWEALLAAIAVGTIRLELEEKRNVQHVVENASGEFALTALEFAHSNDAENAKLSAIKFALDNLDELLQHYFVAIRDVVLGDDDLRAGDVFFRLLLTRLGRSVDHTLISAEFKHSIAQWVGETFDGIDLRRADSPVQVSGKAESSVIGRLLRDGPDALSISELQDISTSIGAGVAHFDEKLDMERKRKEDVRTVFLATEEIFKITQSAHEHIKRESASAKSFFRNIFGRATSNADLLNTAQSVQAGFTKIVSPLVTQYAHTWGPLKTSTMVDDATKSVFTLVRYLMILVNTLVERQELLSKSANNEPLDGKDFKVVQDRYELARADCINARLQARNSMLSDTI